jgi:tetratricopeptide (TPR) repeat protein
MNLKFLITSALAFVTLGAPLAAAQTETPAIQLFEPDESCAVTSPTEDQDQAIVEAAMTALNQRGYGGLRGHLEALRGVADRAPVCYPEVSRRGDVVIMRNEPDQARILLQLITAAVGNRNTSIDVQPNTYPLALLVLGSNDVEHRRYDQAITWLDRGLALQPNNQYLNFEKVAAYMGLRRYQDAATLLQWLIDNPVLELTLDRDRAYRNLGVVLIDLNRLDEAEAALNESIRLEPNNPGARGELEYIAGLRRGEGQRELQLQAPASQPQAPTE